jgi:imidazolonepropionase-like amidohydrolase
MTLVLRNATLWDGVRPEPQPRMEVALDGGRVVAVRPAGTSPTDGEVVDLDGAFLMPGLVDMHVHLTWSGGPDPARIVAAEGLQLTTIRAVANAEAELDGGITSVRDLGGYWDIPITLSRAVEQGHVRGPRIVAAGKTIIMTGGHDPFWGIPSDGPVAVLRAVRHVLRAGRFMPRDPNRPAWAFQNRRVVG